MNWEQVPFCDCSDDEKYLLKDHDILVARTGGTTGKSFIVENPPSNAVFASYLIRLRIKENVHIDFINAFLNSYCFWSQIIEMKSGSAQPNVNAEKLKELIIPECDFEAQKKVVELLKEKNSFAEFPSVSEKLSFAEQVFWNCNQVKTEHSNQLTLIKELRQAFLREAMQGKLVPQDSADEPAEILLEKIKAEKEQLVIEKKIKRDKPLPPINAEEVPFGIPSNWIWCRLSEISNSMSTGMFGTMLHKSDYVESGIPLVNPMNMVNGKIIPSGKMMVNEETKQRLISYELEKGDVVIARRGEMGRCAVVTENENGWLCGTGSFFISLNSFINRNFFVKVFSSDYSKSYLSGFSVGSTMDNLNHRILNSYPFPLPPLAEQERIVAKLEKLMKFCDELEQNIKHGQEQTESLLQVSLKEALQG